MACQGVPVEHSQFSTTLHNGKNYSLETKKPLGCRFNPNPSCSHVTAALPHGTHLDSSFCSLGCPDEECLSAKQVRKGSQGLPLPQEPVEPAGFANPPRKACIPWLSVACLFNNQQRMTCTMRAPLLFVKEWSLHGPIMTMSLTLAAACSDKICLVLWGIQVGCMWFYFLLKESSQGKFSVPTCCLLDLF